MEENFEAIVTTFTNLLRLLYGQCRLNDPQNPQNGQRQVQILEYTPPNIAQLNRVAPPPPGVNRDDKEIIIKCNEIIYQNPWMFNDPNQVVSNDAHVYLVMADYLRWVVCKYPLMKELLLSAGAPTRNQVAEIRMWGPNMNKLAGLMMDYRHLFTPLLYFPLIVSDYPNPPERNIEYVAFQNRIIQTGQPAPGRESQMVWRSLRRQPNQPLPGNLRSGNADIIQELISSSGTIINLASARAITDADKAVLIKHIDDVAEGFLKRIRAKIQLSTI